MEKLVNQLKTNSYIIIVLAILSLTWLLIDYFLLKGILTDNNIALNYNWILITISIIVVVLFHLWVFILVFYSLRVVIKYKSELKKTKAEKEENIKNEFNDSSNNLKL